VSGYGCHTELTIARDTAKCHVSQLPVSPLLFVTEISATNVAKIEQLIEVSA
jgi:hypothetical protein